MKLFELLKTHSWLSVNINLLQIYPDQEPLIEAYESIYEKLKFTVPVDNDILIILKKEKEEEEEIEGVDSVYIEVSGRAAKFDDPEQDIIYALEFMEWNKWLGMELAEETISNFSELEIIVHCLYEMTFLGYNEKTIQKEVKKLNSTIEKLQRKK